MRRRHQQHELVGADDHFEQTGLGRSKRQRAEVEAALLHLHGNLPRRHPADVDGNVGQPFAEPRHQRQQRVDRRFVGADEHPAPTQVAQLPHRRLGLLGQSHETLPVVLQDPSGVGQRAALGRSVEQLLARGRLRGAAPPG